MQPKMTARALGVLHAYAATSLANNAPESLRLVASFAARNPGIELMNYGSGMDGWRAYRREARAVSRDFANVKQAMGNALHAGVTDDDMIEACRMDRLTIERAPDGTLRLDYCTGQYWPTEYRKACVRVLERAASRAWARRDVAAVQRAREC